MLGSFPHGVTGDEIQQGYTAYSILNTGKDEWGDFLPLNPRGFGDYKPPLYSYLTIPFVAVFGLSVFATRILSALSGTLMVLVIYFLAKEFFDRKVGLIAAAMFAIQPWQIFVSRIGWESNLGMLLFSLGALLFIKSFKKNYLLFFSILSLGLSTLSYHSYKLLTLLFLVSVIFIYRKALLKFNRAVVILGSLVLIVFLVVNAYGYIFSGAGKRANDTAIYSEDNISKLRVMQFEDLLPEPFRRIVNNKYQYIAGEFIQNYVGYYSLNFIFTSIRSDYSVLNMSGKGILFIWELPLVLLGVFLLIKEKPKWLKVILLWLILAPIPAALTKDYMHAGRAEVLLPILVVISAFGLYNLYTNFIPAKYKKVSMLVFSLILIWSFIGRVDFYLFHAFSQNQGGIKYGYKEAIDFTLKNNDKYEKIIFTKVNSQPQIFVAFFSKINPKDYQQYSKDWKHFEKDGFKYLDMINYKLGKYEFREINWNSDQLLDNALVVGTQSQLSDKLTPVFEIKDNKGDKTFIGVETKRYK